MKFITIFLLILFSQEIYSRNLLNSLSHQEILKHGKFAYERRCAGCHGLKGDGKGPGAMLGLNPRPRDFRAGVYKFRSTPLETLPTNEDLLKTISQGIKGTSMPAFPLVPGPEKFAIVEYIKTFSPLWKDPEAYGSKVQGASFPRTDFKEWGPFLSRAKKGKVIFLEACATCHGASGEGNGPGGVDLVDDWENPIRPANLRLKTIKTGKTPQDIYRTLLTGIGGTPMPSFKDTYTDDELWHVTAYIFYLRGEEAGMYNKNWIKPIRPSEVE